MNRQEQIEKYITDLIEQRMLKEGDRLFSLREMAAMQHCSITPVMAAYEHLEMTGIIESRPKSGFFVRQSSISQKAVFSPYARLFDQENDEQASRLYHIYGLADDPGLPYPFALRHLPPDLEDNAHMASCIRRCIAGGSDEPSALYRSGTSQALARAVIQWSERAKWLTDPEQICVCTGMMQALTLALESCVSRTDAIAIESPGNSYFFFIARLFGVRIVPIPSHPETGLDLDCFEETVRNDPAVRCLMCMPNYANPTGSLMPVPHKQRLLSLCGELDIAVVEYDIAGDYCFSSRRPLPLKAGGSDQVIYISGLRDPSTQLHYISGGKYQRYIQGFADLYQSFVPPVLQDGLALYLEQPQAKKHLRRIRSELRKATEAAAGEVRASFPADTKVFLPEGGFYLWVELPEGFDTLALLDRSLPQGISFLPGSIFSAGSEFTNCLRLNSSVCIQKPEALEGIRLLASLL